MNGNPTKKKKSWEKEKTGGGGGRWASAPEMRISPRGGQQPQA